MNMYSIHMRNSDIVCVYVYICIICIYCVFVVHNCCHVLFYIVKLYIILGYSQFYMLCTDKYYYYLELTIIHLIVSFHLVCLFIMCMNVELNALLLMTSPFVGVYHI